ncbi:hypothetical protein UACE39S_05355 [Ureibacillus acetophenoni]
MRRTLMDKREEKSESSVHEKGSQEQIEFTYTLSNV